MAGGLVDILDFLELAVQAAGERAIDGVNEHWYEAAEAFNAGQVTIFNENIQSALGEWTEDAWENWPWTDSSVYEYYLWQSYDFEVLERAFSDTIMSPEQKFDEIAYQAQEWQETIDWIQAIFGF